ncbi:MAG: PEP-CTERM sorting domain-containing protein, partial [Verrucomicrobiota bacterium]
GNSASQLSLDFSVDGGLSFVSSVGGLAVNTNASVGGAAEATFGVVNANFIRATFTDNHFDPANAGAGGDRLGIAEIRFTGGEPIPEPGSALLAGLGLIAASLRRRR